MTMYYHDAMSLALNCSAAPLQSYYGSKHVHDMSVLRGWPAVCFMLMPSGCVGCVCIVPVCLFFLSGSFRFVSFNALLSFFCFVCHSFLSPAPGHYANRAHGEHPSAAFASVRSSRHLVIERYLLTPRTPLSSSR